VGALGGRGQGVRWRVWRMGKGVKMEMEVVR